MQTIAQTHVLTKVRREQTRERALADKRAHDFATADRRFFKLDQEQFSRALVMRAMLED
jgi:hypothetical protein